MTHNFSVDSSFRFDLRKRNLTEEVQFVEEEPVVVEVDRVHAEVGPKIRSRIHVREHLILKPGL